VCKQDLDGVDVYKACEMHNMNYKNPAEFTCVFTGRQTASKGCSSNTSEVPQATWVGSGDKHVYSFGCMAAVHMCLPDLHAEGEGRPISASSIHHMSAGSLQGVLRSNSLCASGQERGQV